MLRTDLTLWTREAYIHVYAPECLPLTAGSIYICTLYKQAPSAQSYEVKYDCDVNPFLLHANKSRPHLSTYITTQEEGAVQQIATVLQQARGLVENHN